MPESYFQFKQFTVFHDRSAMKVTTDSCLFGAWCAKEIEKINSENSMALDIGTGTGLLALMVAQKNKLEFDAVEIEEQAAQQSKENIDASPFADCIKIHHIDIANFQKSGYDIIISNPPFYENDLLSPLHNKNTAHHSGSLTLQQLFIIINQKLKTSGNFYLLLPYKRIKEVNALLINNGLFVHTYVQVKQTNNHNPFRVMISGGKIKNKLIEKEIIIKNESDYTDDFITLLKDYYLYL